MKALLRDGYHLHAREDGAPDGPVVLFLNSLGTDLRLWDALLPRLTPGLRVIRYDMRGHGLSDAPTGPYAMDALVEDALAVLDAFEVEEVTLVGLSIGGMIAQALAARRPELARSAALIATGPKIGDAATWTARIETVETMGLEMIVDSVLARWFSEDFRARSPEAALWRNMVLRTTARGYAGCAAAIRDADLTEETRRIRQPTLCVGGALDGSTPPAMVRALAEMIPGAQYEELAGVGHIPCVEAADRLATVLNRFLKAHAFA